MRSKKNEPVKEPTASVSAPIDEPAKYEPKEPGKWIEVRNSDTGRFVKWRTVAQGIECEFSDGRHETVERLEIVSDWLCGK